VKKVSNFLFKLLDIAMALSLAVMAILVFGNVVLRYAFNSGITWSEEMSRYLFIYLVFLGAVGAMKSNEHLGMDTVIKRLPRPLKRGVYIFSNLLMIYTLYLVTMGSIDMTLLNVESTAPATGIPLSFIYGIGVVASIAMALIVLFNTIRAIVDKDSIEELTSMRESEEEMVIVHDDQHAVEGGGR
jgi:TRAP-type transport system small permease protein